MRRGFCVKCNRERSNVCSSLCRYCQSRIATCEKCQKVKRIYRSKSNLCPGCLLDLRYRRQLLSLEKDWSPKTQYNKHIFDLYLTYIRRFQMCHYHIRQTKELQAILTKTGIEPLLSWHRVRQVIKGHPGTGSKRLGCPFTKIGHMLEELGVLPPLREDLQLQTETQLAKLSKPLRPLATDFLEALARSGRTPRTRLYHLYGLQKFENWARSNASGADLFTATPRVLEDYFVHLRKLKKDAPSSRQYISTVYVRLNAFFRYCICQRKILSNPCDKIQVSFPPLRIHICSPGDLRKLHAYIKSPKANPELALLLALTLFHGLGNEELRFAQLSEPFASGRVNLTFRRRPRSYGRRYYNRQQSLRLPLEPAWFARLQKNFLAVWRQCYAETKTTYPRYSLILPRTKEHNRPVNPDAVRNLMERATRAATGISIPIRVLRQTCGHLHTNHRDATPLQQLGWSPQYSSKYPWYNRTYYSPDESPRNAKK